VFQQMQDYCQLIFSIDSVSVVYTVVISETNIFVDDDDDDDVDEVLKLAKVTIYKPKHGCRWWRSIVVRTNEVIYRKARVGAAGKQTYSE